MAPAQCGGTGVTERLRFAPSPTGKLHLGNARTALVNWLVARGCGGSLNLRVEDTDENRNVEGAEQRIFEDLRWLGIDWDEGPDVGGGRGPYRQSDRRLRHQEVVAELLASGAGYYCFEDVGDVRVARTAASETGQPFEWPGRAIDPQDARARVAAGEPAVVRFRAPSDPVRFLDGLRGETGVAAGQIGDFVIARADRSPTYQLAVVADDHDMAVTHVIRGQDHLSNTPGQVALYSALGWEVPRFTHLPLVLGEDRSRLSKRHGATSVAAMRERGVLGEALANYLVLLGWAPPDDDEVLDASAMIGAFDLAGLSPTNVVFDQDKLEWLSQQHMQRLSPDALCTRAAPFFEEAGTPLGAGPDELAWWQEALQLFAPAAHRLEELPAHAAPLFWEPADSPRPAIDGDLAGAMGRFAAAAAAGELDTEDGFRNAARAIGKATGLRGRGLFHPLRELITGQDMGAELARLIPLIQAGSRLAVRPAVLSVEARLAVALAAR